jgi:hypothetical protein
MQILNRNCARNEKKWLLGITFALGGVGLVVTCAISVFAQTTDTDFKPVRVVPQFPPITEGACFPVKPIREVRDVLNPSELVLGVTVDKESRAYPINMLTGPQREIFNDTLGGKAIAATW